MTNQPSDIVYAEAQQLAKRAREYAVSAAYGQMVLGLLYDEDCSQYNWLWFHLKAFRIRRKIKRELRSATRINKAAQKVISIAHGMHEREVQSGGGGADT